MIALLICQIALARVKYGGGGDWYNDQDALPNLAVQVNARTSLKLATEEKIVSLTDPGLSGYPFLYLTGHGKIRFTDAERAALREYLEGGGIFCGGWETESKNRYPIGPFANDLYNLFLGLADN